MEARRLLYFAARLPQNVLQDRGFVVLPYIPPVSENAAIYFPDLAYTSITNFWQKVAKLKLQTPIVAPPQLLADMVNLITPYYSDAEYTASLKRLRGDWQKVEKRFFTTIYKFFPKYKNRLDSINIYISKYGTGATFNLASDGVRDLTIFLRNDSQVPTLMWTILTCLLRPDMEKNLKFSWEECEATVDFLMHETEINCGIKYDKLIMKALRSQQTAKYRQASLRYLKKLNIIPARLSWKMESNGIFFDDLPLDRLSQNERRLLSVLVVNQGQTVDYDTLLSNVWPNQEEINESSVTKQVERLRQKLSQYHVPRRAIQAQRGFGYMLV